MWGENKNKKNFKASVSHLLPAGIPPRLMFIRKQNLDFKDSDSDLR